MNQRTREQWERAARAGGIRPARSMGQNFLVDPQVVSDIADVAGVGPGSCVVEIGPGLGILTRELLTRGASVVAVELDRELKARLGRELSEAEDFVLVQGDARHVDVEPLVGGQPYVLVANLPYSTGTVIIRRYLELPHPPQAMTVMLQREVAERMVATSPNLSLLSLATQLYATPELAFTVPPEVFVPPPKVESAVVRLVLRDTPLAEVPVRERLFELATLAFQRKRKTIGNGLAQGLGIGKDDAARLLDEAGIDPGLRPQAIPLERWIALARASL